MADANYIRFNKRLREIDRQHRKFSSGFVRLEERDGILVPVEHVRIRRGAPMRGIAFALMAFLVFKGFLLSYLGGGLYTQRVETLANGNLAEQMGAWLMGIDPITSWMATQFSQLF